MSYLQKFIGLTDPFNSTNLTSHRAQGRESPRALPAPGCAEGHSVDSQDWKICPSKVMVMSSWPCHPLALRPCLPLLLRLDSTPFSKGLPTMGLPRVHDGVSSPPVLCYQLQASPELGISALFTHAHEPICS